MWMLVCEGCGKDPLAAKVMQQNSHEKCVIYENLHNVDLKNIVDLIATKEICDKFQILYGGDNNNNNIRGKKNEKKKNKKASQKKESHPNEIHPPSVNGATC